MTQEQLELMQANFAELAEAATRLDSHKVLYEIMLDFLRDGVKAIDDDPALAIYEFAWLKSVLQELINDPEQLPRWILARAVERMEKLMTKYSEVKE